MFLNKYVHDEYYEFILDEYDEGYLSTLDEEQFKRIYNLFKEYGFTYIEDIILKYLEIFEMEYGEVKEKLEDLKTELGDNFIYIISNQLSLLDRIFE